MGRTPRIKVIFCVPEGTAQEVNNAIEPVFVPLCRAMGPFEVWFIKEIPGYSERGIYTEGASRSFTNHMVRIMNPIVENVLQKLQDTEVLP